MTRKLAEIFFVAAPGLFFLIGWELFVHGDKRLQFLFSSPSLVWAVAREDFARGTIVNDIWVTSTEAFLGMIVGTVLGTLLGLILALSEPLARIAKPYIVVLGSIPIFAVAPMLIIWFGIGLLSKVVMAAFAVFFVSLIHAYDGTVKTAAEWSHYGESLGARRVRILRHIAFPGALRSVILGSKLGVSLALVGAFIGEFVSSEAGLGNYILTASSLYDSSRVLLGLALICIVGLLGTGAIALIERWKPQLFTH